MVGQERRGMFVGKEFSHQNGCFFCVKWFYMLREVKIMCFFTLKTSNKSDLSLENIFFILGGFQVLW
jgi:hypothetical protein